MNDHETIGVFRGEALLVCSANVCRSPLAEITMTATARQAGLPLRFVSGGTDAREGAAMCHAAARGVPDEPAEHASRPIDGLLVASSDLILTMERSQRGQVARVAPGSQSRTFTLREAVALLELASARIAAGEQERVGSLAHAAAIMHGLRGQLPLHAPSRRRKEVHSTPGAWLTIEDGHNHGTSAHATTIAEVRAASVRLVEELGKVLVDSRALPVVHTEEVVKHAAA